MAAAVGLVAVIAAIVAAPSASAREATVRLADPHVEAFEQVGTVRITVERTDLPVSRIVVDYRTEDSTAVAGADYTHSSGTMVFDVGQSSQSFTVMVRDDDIEESGEHLLLHVSARDGSASDATPGRLTIIDDDLGPAGSTASDGPLSGAPATSEASSSARGGGNGASIGASSPGAAASASTPARPTAGARTTRPIRRRVSYQQSPVTPFELRQSPSRRTGRPTHVDPVLALAAGLLLARVGAEAWFRSRSASR